MTDETTTSRILRLLSLLQSRRSWSGVELADRVGVTVRTVRRDIERMRELGYRIETERGTLGGYRLEAGSDLPPLVFTEDEVVALAVGLQVAATDGTVRGASELTVSVLAKLEQVLPSALHSRMRALQSTVAAPGPLALDGPVNPEILSALALACRDSEIVRFSYAAGRGSTIARRAEAFALVPLGRRWYFLAWDTARLDWRTFRVDRVTDLARTSLIVPRRSVPGGDIRDFVLDRFQLSQSPPIKATIRIASPLSEVESHLGHYTSGLAADGEETLWRISDERVEHLFGALAWLRWPFEITEGEELKRFVRGFDAIRAGH